MIIHNTLMTNQSLKQSIVSLLLMLVAGINGFAQKADQMLTDIHKRCPKAKIMWVTPWRGSNADVVEYFNGVIKSIKKVCKKHRVPVLDASQTVIDPSSADFRKAYFQSETDNAHLNNRGHDLFLPIGEKFILDHLNH